MKISVSKDFGNCKKPVLPLVPEPTVVNKKEDLAQVDPFSDPNDANSTKVKFAFKILEGGTETAPEIIQWFQNMCQAFAELNSNNGLLQSLHVDLLLVDSTLQQCDWLNVLDWN